MEVSLLERIARLGQMGDVVRVRDGYARNYLLPQGKALRATEENAKRFEAERAQIEGRNLERRKEAEAVAGKLNGQSFVVIRQAGETGQLYGSVTARDLAEVLDAAKIAIARNQIALDQPLKTIGLHTVVLALHPEVDAEITVNIARSDDEAERQARGENLADGAEEADDEVETENEAEEAEEAEETEPTAGIGEDAGEADVA